MSEQVTQTVLRQAPDGSWWKVNPDRTMTPSNQNGDDLGSPVPWTLEVDAVFADASEYSVESAQTQANSAQQQNLATLAANSQTALQNNSAFLAIGSPSNAQVLAQVRALTRQMNALIRITTKSLQDISDT